MTTGNKWARREAGMRDERETTAVAHRPSRHGGGCRDGIGDHAGRAGGHRPGTRDAARSRWATGRLLDTDSSALACNSSGPGTIPPPGPVVPLG
jgi:hypothetical protein